ncbi:MAG: GTP-binding protein [Rhizobiales bacterium]|nr:GTP-binding protein [Hyphomicrobiales bacterium]
MHISAEQRPDPLKPIPLTVLTGFLGAGKTTRLNAWLKDPAFADTLVIINEFGAVGLDHLLIEEAQGDMLLMAAGCLCCTIRGDLVATLEDLLRRRDNDRIRFFRRVIIETTGLADPLPILQAVLQHPYLAKRFSIASVLTLVDAVHGASTLGDHAEARRQVALADALVLTKTDLADTAAQNTTIGAAREINPFAPWLDEGDALRPEALARPLFRPERLDEADLKAWLGLNPGLSHVPGHDPNRHGKAIEAFAFVSDARVTEGQLIVFREAMRMLLGPKLLRLKGLVAMADRPDQPMLIHHVQSVSEPPVRLQKWPTRDRRTRIVVIAQGAERVQIEGFWNALTQPQSV